MTDAVLKFIERQRGDASHAALRAGILKRLSCTCLDNTSVEANNAAVRNVRKFYEKQTRSERKRGRV